MYVCVLWGRGVGHTTAQAGAGTGLLQDFLAERQAVGRVLADVGVDVKRAVGGRQVVQAGLGQPLEKDAAVFAVRGDVGVQLLCNKMTDGGVAVRNATGFRVPRYWGAAGSDALEGVTPPPPLEGAQPMPSHCVPDAKCQPQWHL